jgi:uncharacterized protein (DUF2062 family)
LKFSRRIRYYYLRFIRLKGEPQELALGMALGVFTGMMPIMPFQIALAVTLALFLKGSKITAAIGTWISNPLNWYLVYFYDYKLGAVVLGLPERKAVFSSIILAMKSGQGSFAVVSKILEAGGAFAAAFLLGGLILGLIFAPVAYFFFLHFFRYVRRWRKDRRRRREGGNTPPFNTA